MKHESPQFANEVGQELERILIWLSVLGVLFNLITFIDFLHLCLKLMRTRLVLFHALQFKQRLFCAEFFLLVFVSLFKDDYDDVTRSERGLHGIEGKEGRGNC